MLTTFTAPDNKKRCNWCSASEDYIAYHDNEWGFPVDDDFRLFEKICLEGFQSGLSWRTILTKRPAFRQAFHNFDFNKVAKFTEKDINRLLDNAGIVRHRGKIEATINNAERAQELIKTQCSLAAFFWSFEPQKRPATTSIPSTTPESITLSKTLKKLGWKFVGPTTAYAFMQAMGLVNDHHPDCYTFQLVEKARKNFKLPITNPTS